MIRNGTLPKTKGEVILGKGDKLSVKEKEVEDLPGKGATDMELTRK